MFAYHNIQTLFVVTTSPIVPSPGLVTYDQNKDLQSVVRACPLDRILVETDAPYMRPAKCGHIDQPPPDASVIFNNGNNRSSNYNGNPGNQSSSYNGLNQGNSSYSNQGTNSGNLSNQNFNNSHINHSSFNGLHNSRNNNSYNVNNTNQNSSTAVPLGCCAPNNSSFNNNSKRNTLCHPGMGLVIAAKIAELREVPLDTMLIQLRDNVKDMYGV